MGISLTSFINLSKSHIRKYQSHVWNPRNLAKFILLTYTLYHLQCIRFFVFKTEIEQSVYKDQYTMVLLAELIVIIVEKQLETQLMPINTGMIYYHTFTLQNVIQIKSNEKQRKNQIKSHDFRQEQQSPGNRQHNSVVHKGRP